jgi:hypothetical protein
LRVRLIRLLTAGIGNAGGRLHFLDGSVGMIAAMTKETAGMLALEMATR